MSETCGTEQKQRLAEIRMIVNGSRYEQGRFYDLHGSSLGPGPKYLGDAGELLKEVLSLVKSQEASNDQQREHDAQIADSLRYGWNANNTHRQVAETIAAAIRAEKGNSNVPV